MSSSQDASSWPHPTATWWSRTDHVRLTVGPRENGHRPGIDVLFRSAAQAGDGRVIGVVLSGTRDDGTAGLAEIKSRGGAAVVQDPADALYDGMPASALGHVAVDAVVPAAQVATVVTDMVNGASSPKPPQPDPGARPGSIPGHDPAQSSAVTTICPDCGGVLSERSAAGMTQWECRVGHRYSPQSLADAQAENVESAALGRDPGARGPRQAPAPDVRAGRSAGPVTVVAIIPAPRRGRLKASAGDARCAQERRRHIAAAVGRRGAISERTAASPSGEQESAV